MTLLARRAAQALRERVRFVTQPIAGFARRCLPASYRRVLGRPVRLPVVVLVLLVAGVFEPAGAPRSPLSMNLPAAPQARLGEPCWLVGRYPVSFAMDASGTWVGSFAFAGGSAAGHVQVPSTDSHLIADYDAYVADVRLGTYEPADVTNERSRLTCKVVATYHFYCPSSGVVDQFCLTWISHLQARRAPGATGSCIRNGRTG